MRLGNALDQSGGELGEARACGGERLQEAAGLARADDAGGGLDDFPAQIEPGQCVLQLLQRPHARRNEVERGGHRDLLVGVDRAPAARQGVIGNEYTVMSPASQLARMRLFRAVPCAAMPGTSTARHSNGALWRARFQNVSDAPKVLPRQRRNTDCIENAPKS
jgi:hypothetical protein